MLNATLSNIIAGVVNNSLGVRRDQSVYIIIIALFETTVMALDSAQDSLAPRLLRLLRVLCERAKGFRREDGA